jgi:hypothetical protein
MKMKTISLVLFSLFVAAGSVEAQQSASAVPVALPKATIKRIRSYPCPVAPKSWSRSTMCHAGVRVEARQHGPSAIPVALPKATARRIRFYPCPTAPKSWREGTTCRAGHRVE